VCSSDLIETLRGRLAEERASLCGHGAFKARTRMRLLRAEIANLERIRNETGLP